MRILDRYILKNFLVPFLYCFLGFIAIWLAFDLSSNMGDFLEDKVPLASIGYFYLTQAPQIIILILPVALLLSLLYSLSRMSRSNEIISMLSAGQSLYRLVVPLIFVGIVTAAFSFLMNYELAPHAETTRKVLLDAASRKQEKRVVVHGFLFRNRADHRTWFLQMRIEVKTQFIAQNSLNLNGLMGLHITQQDSEGNILRKYYATSARFDTVTKVWTFSDGKTTDFDKDGNVTADESWPTLVVKDWSETPWRIFSSNLDAQNLSVRELRDYLKYNHDFPDNQLAAYRTNYYYRWAVPANCIVIIFLAAPLGIVYSRRGVLAGVASSIFIFFGMMFVDKLFLALGKHGSISPFLAAWANNIFFGALGLLLLYVRASNQDLFKWNLKGMFKKKTT
jgi:LPS export ABC transporter permease LptG